MTGCAMTETRHDCSKPRFGAGAGLAAVAVAAIALLAGSATQAAERDPLDQYAEASPESTERGRAGAESADEAAAYLMQLKKCGRLVKQEKQACVEAARERLRQL